MSERPERWVRLRQAVVGVLIAPSVVGALALFVAEPEAGLLVGAPTLGLAIALWSARGRLLIVAGVLSFILAGFGAFMSFAIGLGWAAGDPSVARSYDAINLAWQSFAIAILAMPAALAVMAIRTRSNVDPRQMPGPPPGGEWRSDVDPPRLPPGEWR